jgi:molecular chaperone DnaK
MLGQFDLVGLPPAPRGMPQVEVTFDIDANGIVNVSARDKATNKEQQIRIQASGGLSDDEIEKMVKDAEQHAAEDRQRKELIEARNQAEGLIHSTQKSLIDVGDKVPQADKSTIEAAIAALKSAAEGEDVEAIKSKTSELAQVAMKMGEALYREQAQSGGDDGQSQDGGGSEEQAGEDVVDAEFEEVRDEDRKAP